jgi:hypothetical protein
LCGSEQASKRAARPGGSTRPGPAQPSPTDFSFGPIHKTHWAGRAKFFVGPARPDVFILFFITFYQILCLSLIIEIYKTVL